MNKIIYFGAILLLFTSCENFFLKEVDIKVDKYPEGIALTGIWKNSLQGGAVFISEAKAILDSTPSPIENAKIEITTTKNRTWNTTFNTREKIYNCQSDSDIEIGEEINIKVTIPNFPVLEAKQIKPDTVSITNIDFIVNGHTDIDGYKSDLIKVQLNDPPQKNYYGIKIFQYDQDGNIYNRYLNSQDQNFKGLTEDDVLVFNDDLFNGRKMTMNLYGYIDNSTGNSLEVELINLSEDLYKYYYSQIISLSSGENPFSEPITIHQNVLNGYGIFGIGSSTKKILEF